MQLVNLEGSAIFGPGSEWFWSMAQFVLVAATLIGIFYQLRLARSANAFEQMNRIVDEWESERMTRHSLEIYLALREGVDLEDIPEGAATSITNFLESVAALIRAGHIDRKLVYEFLGSQNPVVVGAACAEHPPRQGGSGRPGRWRALRVARGRDGAHGQEDGGPSRVRRRTRRGYARPADPERAGTDASG